MKARKDKHLEVLGQLTVMQRSQLDTHRSSGSEPENWFWTRSGNNQPSDLHLKCVHHTHPRGVETTTARSVSESTNTMILSKVAMSYERMGVHNVHRSTVYNRQDMEAT